MTWSPSICALTAGHSFNAWHTALVKNDIKPSPMPYFSLNLSLYRERRSMIGFMSTSLKVVSMAVSFLTATRRLAIVLRSEDIFSARVFRAPGAEIWGGAVGVDFSAGTDFS